MNVLGTESQFRLNKVAALKPAATTTPPTAATETAAPETATAAAAVQISPQAQQAHANHKRFTDERPSSGAKPVPGKLPYRTAGGPKQGVLTSPPTTGSVSQGTGDTGTQGYPTMMPLDPSGPTSFGAQSPTETPIILTLPPSTNPGA